MTNRRLSDTWSEIDNALTQMLLALAANEEPSAQEVMDFIEAAEKAAEAWGDLRQSGAVSAISDGVAAFDRRRN